jgi:tRNA pseudouridine38-40 synthase
MAARVRFRLCLEYNGRGFSGFSRQPSGVRTVSGVLEAAIRPLLKRCQEPLEPGDGLVQGAGRTDAGVHAVHQVAHVDLPGSCAPPAEVLLEAVRYHMHKEGNRDVCLLGAEVAPEGFHARHSARRRAYVYRVVPGFRFGRTASSSLAAGFWGLDVPAPALSGAFRECLAMMKGVELDYSNFRTSGCQAKTTVRTMHTADLTETSLNLVPGGGGAALTALDVHLESEGFLYHQVRMLMATMVAVAKGKIPPQRMRGLLTRELDRLDRNGAMDYEALAPADGLYFLGPKY